MASGAEVKAGENIYFKANTKDKNIVKQWLLNGVATDSNGTYKYTVKLKDAKDEGEKKIINVAFTQEPGVVTITFDEKTVKLNDRPDSMSPRYRASGSEFEVSTKIKFEAQLDTDKKVANWKFNGAVRNNVDAKKPNEKKELIYYVDASDVKDEGGKKVINVSFDTAPSKLTVNYGEKIKCTFNGKVVPSGSEFVNGDQLTFTAELSDGEQLLGWYADTMKFGSNPTSSWSVDTSAEDALDGVVVISYKITNGVTVKVDPKEILYPHSDSKQWKKGDEVKLTARIPAGRTFEGWYRNSQRLRTSIYYTGVDSISGYPWIKYEISEEDVLNGTVTISRKLYGEKIKVNYDSSTVKVFNSSNVLIPSGTEMKENTWIRAEAQVPTGKVLKGWKINGVTDSSFNPGYYVLKHENANNGVITLSCEFVPTTKITVKFDVARIKCINQTTGTEISSGTELDTSESGGYYATDAQLQFTARGADAAKDVAWYVNDIKRSNADTWNVNLSSSMVDGGIVANVDYKVE